VVVTQLPDLSQLNLKRFSEGTSQEELDAFIDTIRPLLDRVIAVFQGKGGQGKTSLATHKAALLAEAEAAKAEVGEPHGRVLIVEMDSQGNTHEDLGTGGDPLNDHGESLAMAVLHGQDPTIIRDVRPCLDMIPSGDELENLAAMLTGIQQKRGAAAWLGLATALAKLVHSEGYAWIVIDCPPVSPEPQKLALVAARWVLVPVSVADSGSINGLGGVSKRFADAGRLNPDLELLGVVLFGFDHRYYTDRKTGERRPVGRWVEARQKVQTLLSDADADAPVFNTVIRKAESVATTCRDRGQLSHEVAEATDGVKWWEKRRGGGGTVLPTDRAEQVGQDYVDLTLEVVERIFALEEQEAVTPA
jgi:chromosome partitioning protein